MGSQTLEEDPRVYTISDPRKFLSPQEFYELFYTILCLWKHPLLKPYDTYIRIMLLEHTSAYVELISKHSDEILEWKYIDEIPKYLRQIC